MKNALRFLCDLAVRLSESASGMTLRENQICLSRFIGMLR
jgi:hypothetical protein